MTWLESSKYVILFLGTLIEGPVFMISGGFLLRTGQLDFFPAYIALVSGDFVADIFWYYVGFFGARPLTNRLGSYIGITPEIIEKIEHRFKKYQDHILFISKITMGFGLALATLTVAGMLKVNFRRYLFINFAGGLIWVIFLMSVGYFFGDIYSKISGPMSIVFVVALLVAVVLALRSINKYLLKKEI